MHDMLNFCTLFDSNYIDRALVMYQSLEAVLDDFKLYVIAFDLKCEEILKDRKDIKSEDRAVSFATAILPCNRRLMFITASLRLFQD